MDDKDQDLLISIVTGHLEKVSPDLAEEFKVRRWKVITRLFLSNIISPSSSFTPLTPRLGTSVSTK